MFEVKKYTPSDKDVWNRFLLTAKNATLLFERDYMDYHSDRFHDHSLMIYRKGQLYGLIPGNVSDNVFYSHQGLTYGGIVMSRKASAVDVIEMFRLINDHLKSEGIIKVVYKPTPYIYHDVPAQEDLYALFRLTDARIIGRQISSTIYLDNKIKFVESRKSGIRKAVRNGVTIARTEDFDAFWEILESNLQNKYEVRPVHSINEIKLLAGRFPGRIRLYAAFSEDGRMLGATVIYIINSKVIHTQYISASLEGKELGALDALFEYLINDEFKEYSVFDFGQSTEQRGAVLNENLIFQKEGFGGRGVLYDIYEYNL